MLQHFPDLFLITSQVCSSCPSGCPGAASATHRPLLTRLSIAPLKCHPCAARCLLSSSRPHDTTIPAAFLFLVDTCSALVIVLTDHVFQGFVECLTSVIAGDMLLPFVGVYPLSCSTGEKTPFLYGTVSPNRHFLHFG